MGEPSFAMWGLIGFSAGAARVTSSSASHTAAVVGTKTFDTAALWRATVRHHPNRPMRGFSVVPWAAGISMR
jgi:hypothetical protein